MCVGWRASAWIMRNNLILLLLLLKLLLICFNFTQIKLIHNRLLLCLLLCFYVVIFMIFLIFIKIYTFLLSRFPALLRIELLSRWINLIFFDQFVISNGIHWVMIEHWARIRIDQRWIRLYKPRLHIVIGCGLCHSQYRCGVFPEESAAIRPHNLFLCHFRMINGGFFGRQRVMLNLN
jgi:hypothetical protein